MGSRPWSGRHVKKWTPNLSDIPLPAPKNLLPVLGSGHTLLGYVSVPAAQRMLAAGHVIGEGTRRRIRALIAVHNNLDLLPAGRPPVGQRYSHNRETPDNPLGVWTFKKMPQNPRKF
jgi:hypothetical protein